MSVGPVLSLCAGSHPSQPSQRPPDHPFPLRSGFRLGDYDAISITRRRGERYKTKLFGATTSAFDVLG